MPFTCTACSLTFSTQVKLMDHIQTCKKYSHEDVEMESESDVEMSEHEGNVHCDQVTTKKSLKRSRENDDEVQTSEKNTRKPVSKPTTKRKKIAEQRLMEERRGVSPTNVSIEEVEDVDAPGRPLLVVNQQTEEYETLPNDMATSTWLRHYLLAINTRVKLFSCHECKQLYTSKNIEAHVKSHRKTLPQGFKKKITEIVQKMGIIDHYPILSKTEEIMELGGVEVQLEYGCPECAKAGTEVGVTQHIYDNHPGKGLKPVSNVGTQVMNKGAARTKYRIRRFSEQSQPPAQEECSAKAEWKKTFCNSYRNVFTTARAPSNARYVSPWLQHTGWAAITDDKEVQPFVDLVASPEKKGPLGWVHNLVDDYMEAATKLLQVTSNQTKQRLNSSEPETGLNHSPLEPHHQHETTIKKYAEPVIHLVATLLRDPLNDFAFASTPELNEALTDLKESKSQEDLHRVFVQLWLHEWPSRITQSFPDPTLTFLALSTLKSTGEWAHPREVTGTIAKLHRAIRLTVLTELHQRLRRTIGLHEMTEMKNLQVWVKSHEMSTFADLYSLQKYASTIVYNTIGFPKVVFPNRRKKDYNDMLYDGNPVSIGGLQKIEGKMEDRIVDLFQNRVLLGKKLRVDYTTVSDNLSSSVPGECFLDNKNNDFHKHMDDLGNAIFDDPDLFKEFMVQDPSGKWVINEHRAMMWFEDLAEVEAHTALGTEMKSGAPIRLTELVCSLMRNRHTRTRNVMAVGDHLALVGQYSKTTSQTGLDKITPRAFPGFEQDVVVQLHTFARPFAIFLAEQLWPEQPEIAMAYSELLFMGVKKELNPDHLSALMGKISASVLGWSMKIRPYRHINIAFKGHKCKGLIDQELEKEIISEIHALQSGHSVATERRIYGLDKENLNGISEDMIALYLDASMEYQKAFGIPVGGSGLPYTQLRMADFVQEEEPSTPAAPAVAQASTDLSPLLAMLTKMQQGQDLLLQKVSRLETEVADLKQSAFVVQPSIPPITRTPSPGLEYVDREPEVPIPSVQQPDDFQMGEPLPFNDVSMDFDEDRYQGAIDLTEEDDEVEESASNTVEVITIDSDEESEDEFTGVPVEEPITQDYIEATRKDMLGQLRQLVGPQAVWKSKEQKEAVHHLLSLNQDVIVALPTGIGKSVIALLPSQVENAVTVIVVPLVALMQDWKRRLNAFGIAYEHFEGTTTGDKQ
ncbi:hypothetical protein NMY22_g4870 [Coprinellus aureogranulatus]|nr:hypothetical protein NMY22_g4870 [Coprinellus aureogranulatus]